MNKLKVWLAEAILKRQVNQYLKEENQMEGKSWYQSKAVWAAVIGAILGAVQPVSMALGHPIMVPSWVYEVLGSAGLYALRDGVGKPLQ